MSNNIASNSKRKVGIIITIIFTIIFTIGISFFGAGSDLSEAKKPFIIKKLGIPTVGVPFLISF